MIPEAITTILTGDSSLTDAIPAAKMHPVRAPKEATAPLLVYRCEDETPEYDKDGAATIASWRVQITLFNTNYKTNWTNSDLVIAALDQYTGTTNGVTIEADFEGRRDGDFDPDLTEYELIMDFRIREKR